MGVVTRPLCVAENGKTVGERNCALENTPTAIVIKCLLLEKCRLVVWLLNYLQQSQCSANGGGKDGGFIMSNGRHQQHSPQ